MPGETPEETLFRELEEEVGLRPEHVEIIASTEGWLSYRLPRRFLRRLLNRPDSRPHCIGQRQKWFLLRLTAAEEAIDLFASDSPEFKAWRWVNYWYPIRKVVHFKRGVYARALRELAPALKKEVGSRRARKGRDSVPGRRNPEGPLMLDTLRRIVQEVNNAPDIRTALDLMAKRVRDAMGTEVCSIYLRDEDDQRYVLMASEGLKQEAVGNVSLGLSEGLIGQVGMREEPVNLEDAASPDSTTWRKPGKIPSMRFLGVPVMHHGKVLGVMVVQQRDVRRFDQSEEAFLVTISAQLSAVIAHAHASGVLFDQLDTGGVDLPSFYDGLPGCPGRHWLWCPVVSEADLASVPDRQVEDVGDEISRLDDALVKVRQEVRDLAERASKSLGAEEQALFDVYLRMLDRHALPAEVIAQIREGQWAQGALRDVVDQHVRNFEMMDDPYLRERAADVRDLGRRVLAQLQRQGRRQVIFPDECILLGEDISAPMLMEVPRERIEALLPHGARATHTWPLSPVPWGSLPWWGPRICRSNKWMTRKSSWMVSVAGWWPTRHRSSRRSSRKLSAKRRTSQAGLEKLRHEPAETEDGARIRLQVNTGLMTDINRSLERAQKAWACTAPKFLSWCETVSRLKKSSG